MPVSTRKPGNMLLIMIPEIIILSMTTMERYIITAEISNGIIPKDLSLKTVAWSELTTERSR